MLSRAIRPTRRLPRLQCLFQPHRPPRQRLLSQSALRLPLRSPILQQCPRRTFTSTPRRLETTTIWVIFKRDWRKIWRENPIAFTLAMTGIGVGALFFLFYPFYYINYVVKPYHNYPEPVAKKLRRAMFYSDTQIDPKNATKYFRQALDAAKECNMHAFSDEVLGIKLMMAALFEKIHSLKTSAQILEVVKKDCMRFVEEHEWEDWEIEHRTRLLSRTVGISVKLGELYSDPLVKEPEKAEENLVWAVETTLKETRRRQEEGVKENEGPWMSDEEVGGAIEALAEHFESRNKFSYALPLYRQALVFSPPNSCHTAIIMNNVAASLVQQIPPVQSKLPYGPDNPNPRDTLITQATQWATNAFNLATKIQGEDRTEECDVGCAVATQHLGEFAEMQEQWSIASRHYKDAARMAKEIGFEEGEKEAKMALKRMVKKGQ